jgi:MFS family permease
MAYVLGYVGHSYELFAFRAWIVAFLVFAVAAVGADTSRSEITLYVAIYSLVGMPASIIGAYLAESGRRPTVLSSITTMSFLIGAGYGFLAGQPLIWVVLVGGLYSAIIMADSAAFTAGTVKMARRGERGATLAVHSVCGFSGGFLGPLAVGAVLDVAGGQGSSFAWTLGCFTMALGSLAALAGIRFMLYLAGAPDKKRTAID